MLIMTGTVAIKKTNVTTMEVAQMRIVQWCHPLRGWRTTKRNTEGQKLSIEETRANTKVVKTSALRRDEEYMEKRWCKLMWKGSAVGQWRGKNQCRKIWTWDWKMWLWMQPRIE